VGRGWRLEVAITVTMQSYQALKREILKRKETIEVLMERKGDGDGLEVLNV